MVFINFEPVSDVRVKDCEFNSVHEVLDFVIKLNVKRVKNKRRWVYNYKAMEVDTIKSYRC